MNATIRNALVTSSDALAPSSFLLPSVAILQIRKTSGIEGLLDPLSGYCLLPVSSPGHCCTKTFQIRLRSVTRAPRASLSPAPPRRRSDPATPQLETTIEQTFFSVCLSACLSVYRCVRLGQQGDPTSSKLCPGGSLLKLPQLDD